MTWIVTGDLDVFLATAGGLLGAGPAEHIVLLTVSATSRERGPGSYGAARPRFGWWRDGGGRVAAALLDTPPHAVQSGALPDEAVAPLADRVRPAPHRLSGVTARTAPPPDRADCPPAPPRRSRWRS
ncbi:hypothetical protein [Streptomyces sp. NBC_01803]|uniref:hypothetical protein n=1 Tax=Streptomyces sp. NBC_01803 TaxID=2975946 RepID=UPI002DD92AC9|nr:hypothetical protein [Streptomyces sp. NBC_01803]WSA43814.1 hypothetical protein OIE51_06100 [Streptomyces sp. NBC_01803]